MSDKIKVGSRIVVKDAGEIYSTYTEFANRIGFPNSADDDLDEENNPIDQRVCENLEGVVLAMDKHSKEDDNIICVIETDDKFQFLIDIKGIEKIN